jgi:hypothetical protein
MFEVHNRKLNKHSKRFEDTKGVISIRKSKDRQHNGQQEKGQKWKQRYTQKTKDRAR